MKIYLHIEILVRELDSRLLLAVLAAARGHEVVLGDIPSLYFGARKRALPPGVLLTKSLTPSAKKIARHRELQNQSFVITSIDEESGLATFNGRAEFTRQRFSRETLQQASAAFCWGREEQDALTTMFPDLADKAVLTGSPRVDLWRPQFASYWTDSPSIPSRPFLLISSNFGLSNSLRLLHEDLTMRAGLGYFAHDDSEFKRTLGIYVEGWKLIIDFVEAIKHLSHLSDSFDIVLRPHPGENEDTWKVLLDGIPNVHVIREGNIAPWVRKAFAVLHNGCTTAFEARIIGTPVVAYTPFSQEFEITAPNDLSKRIRNLDELGREITRLFECHQEESISSEHFSPLPDELLEKISIDRDELAAEKILNFWETLNIPEIGVTGGWLRYRFFLAISAISLRFRGRKKQEKLTSRKYPGLDMDDIQSKVNRLRKLLGVGNEISLTRFSNKVFLVRAK